MGITKKELADTLGVSKQTVVNYIDRLGLAPEHVSRVGKYDVLDDFAVSAISDAVGKSVPQRSESDDAAASDSVIAALSDRIADLKEQNGRLAVELAALRASRDDRVATIAERQQAIAATPWWKRGRIAMKLLGPGSE